MDKLGPKLGVYSSGSSLAWNWIIEYLSSFPQIDASIICRLIDISPLLPEDIEVDTNEKLALRCLEMLFGPQNSLASVAPRVPGLAFHPSRSCNDILQCILREVPLSNLEIGGPELLKWDGHSFIEHKRATLPKCALEKLKDFILADIPVFGDITCPNVLSKESSHVEDGAQPKGPCGGDAGESIDKGFTLSSPNSPYADGLQQNIGPGDEKSGTDHPRAEEICECEDMISNIALQKKLFLSSQGMPSQVPVQNASRTEQICVKCNQDGQVLVCSASGCPIVVHESCLNCAARFDDKGKFLCPFCAYSSSISKYVEAKDSSILTRKKLASMVELLGKLRNKGEHI